MRARKEQTMYYEEAVIDGVLHYRTTPDGKWTPKTAAQLTELLIESRRKTLWMFDATNALRDFAATVAENALLAERAAGREPDPRSWAAVQFVRDLLAGKIKEEDRAAADAAWAAAWAVARAAADAAAWAAADAAWGAADAAAWAVARGAADAAWEAAWAAQNALLLRIIEKWR